MMNTAERLVQCPPQKDFQLILLYNLDEKHALFAKDYQQPKKVKNTNIEEVLVDNASGFFTGLPECKFKRRITRVGQSKAIRDERKLQAMQKAYEHLGGRLAGHVMNPRKRVVSKNKRDLREALRDSHDVLRQEANNGALNAP